jgi:hypothetical protein
MPTEPDEVYAHLPSHLARSAEHSGLAIAQRRQAVGCRRVVPPHVTESAHPGVAEPTIEFDQQAIVLVEHIDLGTMTTYLPPPDRQTVCPLDLAEIVKF